MTSEKTIFIACPIGEENTDVRKESDRVLKFLIRPVAKSLGIASEKCPRGDEISRPGKITRQILEALVQADVVVADLSRLNANVLYEVGIRQALLKPYVLIARTGTVLPFDLHDYRTVFYDFDLESIDKAKRELTKHLEAALTGELEALDQKLFSRANELDRSEGENEAKVIFNALADVAAAEKITQGMISALIKRFELPPVVRSAGSYVFIDGEKPAFAELIAATRRAKNHVRSTRFFSKPITGKQPEYAAAIIQRVLGTPDIAALSHYSRIIQANNIEKIADVESYLRQFSGKPFTIYLTYHSNNFELVIIDDQEVFIHFYAKESVIGSTLHSFGQEVATRFISIFDRLHDPNVYPQILKVDCKYVNSDAEVESNLEEVKLFFASSPTISNPASTLSS